MIFHSFVMFFVCLPEGIGLFHAANSLPCADVSRWAVGSFHRKWMQFHHILKTDPKGHGKYSNMASS